MKEFAKRIIRWLAKTKLSSPIGKAIFSIILYKKRRIHRVAIYYDDPERANALSLVRKIKKEADMQVADNEAYQIFMAVKRAEKIEGDIAEVGVYRGGTAQVICEAKQNRPLHLFDTFEGLPDLSGADNPSQFRKGQFIVPFQEVKMRLGKYPNVYIYKGLFPKTAEPIKNKKFSFVNFDVDLYEPTAACLEFFYPRMSRGGVMISHDYINSPGVRKAFDDFFRNQPETIIELSGSQCLIIKL